MVVGRVIDGNLPNPRATAISWRIYSIVVGKLWSWRCNGILPGACQGCGVLIWGRCFRKLTEQWSDQLGSRRIALYVIFSSVVFGCICFPTSENAGRYIIIDPRKAVAIAMFIWSSTGQYSLAIVLRLAADIKWLPLKRESSLNYATRGHWEWEYPRCET